MFFATPSIFGYKKNKLLVGYFCRKNGSIQFKLYVIELNLVLESLLFQRWPFSVSVHVNLVKTERGIIKVYFLNKQISSGILIHDIVIICFHTSNKFIQPMFEELRITPFMKNKYFNVVWLNTTVCQDNLTGSNYKDSSLRILYFRSVVKWSACSPSTPTIQVRIPLKPTVFM